MCADTTSKSTGCRRVRSSDYFSVRQVQHAPTGESKLLASIHNSRRILINPIALEGVSFYMKRRFQAMRPCKESYRGLVYDETRSKLVVSDPNKTTAQIRFRAKRKAQVIMHKFGSRRYAKSSVVAAGWR